MVIRIYTGRGQDTPSQTFIDKTPSEGRYKMEIENGCLCVYKYFHPDHPFLCYSISGYFRAIQSEL